MLMDTQLALLNPIQECRIANLPEKTPEAQVALFYGFQGFQGKGSFPGISVQFSAKPNPRSVCASAGPDLCDVFACHRPLGRP